MPHYFFKSIAKAIEYMESCIGYLEKATKADLGDMTPEGKIRNAGYNNFTLYWQWYKEATDKDYNGQAYCACFVSVMLCIAFGIVAAKRLLCGDLFIYCPDGYNRFKKKGRIYDVPEVGDIVFFYNNSLGRYGHTGFVVKILKDDKGKTTGFVTIEANTSSGNDTVVRNGGATCRKSYTLKSVNAAFGRPDYDAEGITIEDETAAEIVKYPIATSGKGLKVTADETLNVRNIPSTKSIGDVKSKVIGSLKKAAYVKPTYKAFDERGVRWYYIEDAKGWISGNYLEGWIQENPEQNAGTLNEWWYLLSGGGFYSHCIAVIDGKAYAFNDNGYMATEPVTAYPDASGALSMLTRE